MGTASTYNRDPVVVDVCILVKFEFNLRVLDLALRLDSARVQGWRQSVS